MLLPSCVFSTPVHTAKYHQPFDSEPPKCKGFDRHDERPEHMSRAMRGVSGFDQFSKIVDSIPFDDVNNTEQSWADKFTGSTSISPKNTMHSSRAKALASSMRDNPIDLTLDKDSDVSSPPPTNSPSA